MSDRMKVDGIMLLGHTNVVLLWGRRICEIAAELQDHIRQMSLIQLEDLAEALLDFEAQADLVAWLQRVEDRE